MQMGIIRATGSFPICTSRGSIHFPKTANKELVNTDFPQALAHSPACYFKGLLFIFQDNLRVPISTKNKTYT